MKINKIKNGSSLTMAIEGRLDTITSSDLSKEITSSIDGVTELILDIENLEYISSSGLRVLLSTQKSMNSNNGKMIVKNVPEIVMEVFDITGFVDILNIEWGNENENRQGLSEQ